MPGSYGFIAFGRGPVRSAFVDLIARGVGPLVDRIHWDPTPLARVRRACGEPAAPFEPRAFTAAARAAAAAGGGAPEAAGAVIVRLNNGLGNQLWQYAFGRLLAEVSESRAPPHLPARACSPAL